MTYISVQKAKCQSSTSWLDILSVVTLESSVLFPIQKNPKKFKFVWDRKHMMNVPNKHLFSLRSTEIWAVAKGMFMSESWCKFSQHCFFTTPVIHGLKERTTEGGKRKTIQKGWVKINHKQIENWLCGIKIQFCLCKAYNFLRFYRNVIEGFQGKSKGILVGTSLHRFFFINYFHFYITFLIRIFTT